MSNHESRYILLVEDDEVDRMTVKRAVRKLKIPNNLITAENGEEALNLLKMLRKNMVKKL